MAGAGDRPRHRLDLDVPQRPADRVQRVGQEERVDRAEDAAAQRRVRNVDRAELRVGALVGEDQLVALLRQRQGDLVRVTVAGACHLEEVDVAPGSIGQPLEPAEEALLPRRDDLAHDTLHDLGAVALEQLQDAGLRDRVAGDHRAQIERAQLRQPRAAQELGLEVGSNAAVLDHAQRRRRHRLVEDVVRLRAEAPRRAATDVREVQEVRDPAEELALPEDRAQHRRVLLMGRPHPGIVGEEHVTIANTGVLGAVLERPLDVEVEHSRVELEVWPEVDELAVLGEDRRVEVMGEDRNRRARHLDDRRAMLLVDVPEVVADHLVGDRVDVRRGRTVQLEARRDPQLWPRDVRLGDAVPHDLRGGDRHQESFPSRVMIRFPSESVSARLPAWTTTVVQGSSTRPGPTTTVPAGSATPRNTSASTKSSAAGL